MSPPRTPSALGPALRERGVIVCVGSGGVGKTTVAAILGLRAAAIGRRTLVCTIDPARRLADALGLGALGNAPAEISSDVLKAAKVPLRAPLEAMMLDMKQSWDALIAAHAPPEQRTRILENRFYQALSTALAGSQEYIALETLGQLRQTGRWDLIILDTPPTAHALDFLDAPNRILDFLDNDAARWLLTPALKVLNRGGGIALRTLSRITGAETLQELATFLLAVSGMNEGFRERARAVRALLSSPETAFALVTSAAPERREEAASFQRTLEESGMALAAVVVNRVHARPSANARKGAEGLSAPLRGKMLRTLEEAEALAARDADGIAALRALGPRTALVAVPQFPGALHDLGALWRAGAYLLGEAALR